MITKIKLYNAPYEMPSADRFYKDIDNKLAKHYVADILDFSYNISSTTEMEVTLNDKTARGSYMAIESSLFKNKTTSYWFLTAITEIESDEGTRYKATLDAIATFGEDVFNKLNGKKVKIDRLHEDRYKLTGGNFELNKDNHGLINTDFKVGETKGVELVFDGASDENSADDKTQVNSSIIWKSGPTITGIEVFAPFNTPLDVSNVFIKDGKKYYAYGFINILGAPEIFEEDVYIGGDYLSTDDHISRDKNSAMRNSLLFPISLDNSTVTSTNALSTVSRFQEGKIVNIIKLPYEIKQQDSLQILFDEAGKRYTSVVNVAANPNVIDLLDDNFAKVNIDEYVIYPKRPTGAQKTLYQLFAYNDIISIHDDDIISIPSSKLNEADIMDFIANTKTPTEMKAIIDAGETERLEVGLLNSSIMPIEMFFHDNKVILDFYNFANKVDKTSIKGSYTINEMGLESVLAISENQFAGWAENTIMSFATDQGATYLARNKYSNDAAKKGIDLSAKQAELQAHLQMLQGRDQAGNIIAGAMSLGASTAAGVHQADYAGQIEDLQPKIAENKKAQIQASINDASATAPSTHLGSDHNLANLNSQEFKHNFNWIMRKPNRFLRNKIVEFLDRHGYVFHDWIPFTKGMVESRSRFNYIEMDEFKDFLGTFNDFDINVLNLLDAELKKGLRLWHVDEIDYNSPNLEKIIVENI